MKLAVCFTNFGPYHLARLRALAALLDRSGGQLLAVEVAGAEERYPWLKATRDEPFAWVTLFPGRALESLPRAACIRAMTRLLEQERPDALGIVGYARPESMAALRWATRTRRPTILMSESQAIDHPRVWWKEAVKKRRVPRFSAALVGGPRHRDYLVSLGMPAHRITLGYDAVDHAWFAREADRVRSDPNSRRGLPGPPYLLAVSRFVREKNLPRLVRAYARFRLGETGKGWTLALCGDGPGADEVEAAIGATGIGHAIHRPGFLQADELVRWYAHAAAFVHPSLMEPWGLVVNEAAACGLPLLVSESAGCAETLVPDPPGTTGMRFDPRDEQQIEAALSWLAGQPEDERRAMGRRAAEVASRWGPERFAQGTLEALERARIVERSRRPARRRVVAGSAASRGEGSS